MKKLRKDSTSLPRNCRYRRVVTQYGWRMHYKFIINHRDNCFRAFFRN